MFDDSDTGLRDAAPCDELADEITQPLAFAISRERASQTQSNGLFERLAGALGLGNIAVERVTSELLVYVDASPATLTAAQLWNMRTGLFELVDNVLPTVTRERARSRLQILMLEVAPVDREGSD